VCVFVGLCEGSYPSCNVESLDGFRVWDYNTHFGAFAFSVSEHFEMLLSKYARLYVQRTKYIIDYRRLLSKGEHGKWPSFA
jgi:hypothetical protein